MSKGEKFDRSKFKSTSREKLDEKEEDLNKKIPTPSNQNPYHKIEEGKNYFRAYPARDGEDSYVYPKVTHWLPIEYSEKDDKGKVKKTIKRSPIFNAKVHGDLPYDPSELFLETARRLVSESSQDADDVTKKLNPIEDWKNGIRGQKNWVLYADKFTNTKGDGKVFGTLEMYDSTYRDSKKRIAIFEDEDGIEDPISDVDNGRIFIITKTTTKNKDKSKVEYTFDIHFKENPLSDEDLKEYLTKEPLSKRFVKSYTRKDFEKSIKALQYLDNEHEYGVFEDEDFLNKIEELSELLPEDSDEEQDEISLENMNRSELKSFIKENNLQIVIKSSMSDDDIRELITEELEVKNIKDSEEEEQDDEEEEEEEKPKKNVFTKKLEGKEELKKKEKEKPNQEVDELPFEEEGEDKPKSSSSSKKSDHISRVSKAKALEEDEDDVDEELQNKLDKFKKK